MKKTHKSYAGYKMWCEVKNTTRYRRGVKLHWTWDWNLVTCKLCLRMKHKEDVKRAATNSEIDKIMNEIIDLDKKSQV